MKTSEQSLATLKKKTAHALAEDVFVIAYSRIFQDNLHYTPLPDHLAEQLWMSDPVRLQDQIDVHNVDDMLRYYANSMTQ